MQGTKREIIRQKGGEGRVRRGIELEDGRARRRGL